MRVALNAWFWEQPETGSGQYTRRLVEHLAALDPALEVVLIQPPPVGPLGKVFFEQWSFPRRARQVGADVAHVPYWASPLVSPVPVVVTIHDLIPLRLRAYRGGPLVRLYTALVSATASSAALVLTDSEASRQDVLTCLGLSPQRVRAVPLAADARFRPEPAPDDDTIRARYGLPPRYILYLGGFDVRKNLATALRAYCWVGPVLGAECPLVLAGRLPEKDTPFTPDPRRLAREAGLLPEWVRFIGPVAEADKPAVYRGAVAFLYPSRYEGFGLPPLEAMACGVPVVGSDVSSIPEVVGPGGILFPPDDAEGMAGALLQLAQDADFRAGMRGCALAQARRFSWEETARRTLEAYRDARFSRI
ncbi:MAG: glycosyltransferase family 1 protein [Anaerolineae bacterium]|nr:glycosyltransferase family 4 protein [Anaerolineae bacterium]MDW8067424.1 glycosyltransferase family 1 protein [Anaerolineae bacterium]